VFTILPPRPELVVEKHFIFAAKIAEGKVSFEVLNGVKLNLSRAAIFFRVLLTSLETNRDLTEILANITAGNIRAVMDFVRRFIGNPNVEAEKIVSIKEAAGTYTIPPHEFSKAAILGDYSHFIADTSLAMNLFDVVSADRKEPFLSIMIVAFLMSDGTWKDRDGFAPTSSINEEMRRWGFSPAQTEKSLRGLTNKRLIETTERMTFEEDLTGFIGDIPDGFRLTSIGACHLRRWVGYFAYLNAMVVDTPIFDETVRDSMIEKLDSFEIADRYQRTLAFRNYLSATSDSSAFRPTYFDWNEAIKYGQGNFDAVKRAIERNLATNSDHRSGNYGRPECISQPGQSPITAMSLRRCSECQRQLYPTECRYPRAASLRSFTAAHMSWTSRLLTPPSRNTAMAGIRLSELGYQSPRLVPRIRHHRLIGDRRLTRLPAHRPPSRHPFRHLMRPSQRRIQRGHGRRQILRLIPFERPQGPEPHGHQPTHPQLTPQPNAGATRRLQHPPHAPPRRARQQQRGRRIARQRPQQSAQPFPMRLHRVEPPHQQIEQLFAHRTFTGRFRECRLIHALAKPPQQRVLSRKPHPGLGQRQTSRAGRSRDRHPRPTCFGGQPEGRRDQRLVEIWFGHRRNVSGKRVRFNPPIHANGPARKGALPRSAPVPR
jgi:hypothetical protein